jgi:hypothetical protein
MTITMTTFFIEKGGVGCGVGVIQIEIGILLENKCYACCSYMYIVFINIKRVNRRGAPSYIFKGVDSAGVCWGGFHSVVQLIICSLNRNEIFVK